MVYLHTSNNWRRLSTPPANIPIYISPTHASSLILHPQIIRDGRRNLDAFGYYASMESIYIRSIYIYIHILNNAKMKSDEIYIYTHSLPTENIDLNNINKRSLYKSHLDLRGRTTTTMMIAIWKRERRCLCRHVCKKYIYVLGAISYTTRDHPAAASPIE